MTIVRVVRVLMPISSAEPQVRGWCYVNDGPVPLRCWWAPTGVETGAVGRAARNRNETESYQERKRAVLVLPEVFGVNAWVRSVADRIAATGVPALAMPLFARTAPELDLSYGEMQLAEGRGHKSATTAAGLFADGHTARGGRTFDFYGAGVAQGHPGGGAPTLDGLPQVKGQCRVGGCCWRRSAVSRCPRACWRAGPRWAGAAR